MFNPLRNLFKREAKPPTPIQVQPPLKSRRKKGKNRPGYRRREAVYAALEEAWKIQTNPTYVSLSQFVKEKTGKACTDRTITNWKRQSPTFSSSRP